MRRFAALFAGEALNARPTLDVAALVAGSLARLAQDDNANVTRAALQSCAAVLLKWTLSLLAQTVRLSELAQVCRVSANLFYCATL